MAQTHIRLIPEDTFMLLIDHQDGTLNFVRNVSREGIVKNTRALARVAKVLDMPIVLTSSQEDQAQGLLIDDMKEILPDAYAKRIRRGGIANAWDDLDFRAAALEAADGRRNVILAGVTNDVCTVLPAISLAEDGFTVKVVQDAGGSINRTAEDVARRTWERGGALAQVTFEEIVVNLDLF